MAQTPFLHHSGDPSNDLIEHEFHDLGVGGAASHQYMKGVVRVLDQLERDAGGRALDDALHEGRRRHRIPRSLQKQHRDVDQ